MKLKALLKKLNKDSVWNNFKNLKNIKSEHRELFDKMFDQLLSLKPVNQKDYTIFMQYVEDCEGGINDSYYSIQARKKNNKTMFSHNMIYCLMYDHWENWLGMNVDLNDPNVQGGVWEINFFMAQIMWEMTWLGFDYKQVEKKLKEKL